MGKKKQATHEQHLSNADDLALALHYLMEVERFVFKNFSKSSDVYKVMQSLDILNPYGGTVDTLRSKLDHEYHEATSDKQFEKEGNIYNGMHRRAERILLDGAE